MEVTRHFTATTIIVHGNKVLLHKHKKLKRWLPVGGHIDRDELPLDAARREVKEEAGLDVEFYGVEQELHEFPDVRELVRPVRLLLEDINPYHQHIDFVFYAKSKTADINEDAEEYESLRWFSLDELKHEECMPEDVVFLAQEAIQLLSK